MTSSWDDAMQGAVDETALWEGAKAFHHRSAAASMLVQQLLHDVEHATTDARRAVAAWTMGFVTLRRRHVPTVIEQLVAVGSDRSAPTEVRCHAVEAIAHQLQHSSEIGLRRRAARRLASLVDEVDGELRYWAAFTLGQLGVAPSARPLRRLMTDADPRVRDEAADAIVELRRLRRRPR